MRFAMTTDGWVKGTTVGTVVLLGVTFPLVSMAVAHPGVPWGVTIFSRASVAVVGLVLLWTMLGAPRAVKVTTPALVIERLVLPDVELPWTSIAEVREAPPIELRGEVRRVAGNGGFFGFTGLYAVSGVGTVRCWATRLHRPTVLVSRHGERPVLLGVDDPHGLLEAIHRRRAHHG